ncbi:hypothetical protein GSF22_25300 [Micromonospora echinofusca]|uniref:Syndecan 1 n=1 Tax=Micromonospora echinofusca TaxID=47858 RepID=A0ABS3VXL3_MICEH|nr:hypothetical protein [Micromonospora echinofusca]
MRVVPATVDSVSALVAGLPPMLPGVFEGVLDPVVSLTDRLLGTLLPPVAVCPVDSGPTRAPVPVTEPAPPSQVGGGADQGQAPQVPPDPVPVRASLWSPWSPILMVRQPASLPALGRMAVVGPAGPSPPGALDRPGDPGDDHALTADRGAGSGPAVHRGWRWLHETAATGAVARYATAAAGRTPAVVARPG